MDHVTLTSSERLAETVDDKANKSWFRPNIFSQREKEEESGNGTWLCWPTRIPEVSSWPAIDEVPLETGPFSLENISANWLALIQSFRALFFDISFGSDVLIQGFDLFEQKCLHSTDRSILLYGVCQS